MSNRLNTNFNSVRIGISVMLLSCSFSLCIAQSITTDEQSFLQKVKKRFTGEIYHVLKNNNDIKQGPYHRYDNLRKKKNLLISGHYHDNLKEGKWEYFDKEGNLIQSGYYSNGSKSGMWTENYCGHQVLTSYGSYSDGKKADVWNYLNNKSNNHIMFDHTKDSLINITMQSTLNQLEFGGVFGGNDCFDEYLKRDFVCPQDLLSTTFEVTIVVSFIVHEDFSLQIISIKDTITKSLRKEVIRLLKNGPIWIPRKQNGEYISTSFIKQITVSNI